MSEQKPLEELAAAITDLKLTIKRTKQQYKDSDNAMKKALAEIAALREKFKNATEKARAKKGVQELGVFKGDVDALKMWEARIAEQQAKRDDAQKKVEDLGTQLKTTQEQQEAAKQSGEHQERGEHEPTPEDVENEVKKRTDVIEEVVGGVQATAADATTMAETGAVDQPAADAVVELAVEGAADAGTAKRKIAEVQERGDVATEAQRLENEKKKSHKEIVLESFQRDVDTISRNRGLITDPNKSFETKTGHVKQKLKELSTYRIHVRRLGEGDPDVAALLRRIDEVRRELGSVYHAEKSKRQQEIVATQAAEAAERDTTKGEAIIVEGVDNAETSAIEDTEAKDRDVEDLLRELGVTAEGEAMIPEVTAEQPATLIDAEEAQKRALEERLRALGESKSMAATEEQKRKEEEVEKQAHDFILRISFLIDKVVAPHVEHVAADTPAERLRAFRQALEAKISSGEVLKSEIEAHPDVQLALQQHIERLDTHLKHEREELVKYEAEITRREQVEQTAAPKSTIPAEHSEVKEKEEDKKRLEEAQKLADEFERRDREIFEAILSSRLSVLPLPSEVSPLTSLEDIRAARQETQEAIHAYETLKMEVDAAGPDIQRVSNIKKNLEEEIRDRQNILEKYDAEIARREQESTSTPGEETTETIETPEEEPVTLEEWTDADTTAEDTEHGAVEEEAVPPLPPEEVVWQVMETLSAEDFENPDALYEKIADIIKRIGPERFGIEADAPAEFVDRLIETYYRYTLDSIEQMLQQGLAAKRAEDAKREGKFTAFLKRNIRNIVSGGLFGIGRKAGTVAVIGGAAYFGVGISTMGAGLIVGAGIGAGMGVWEYARGRGTAGREYFRKKQEGRIAQLARELGLAPATVEGGTPGEDEEGPLSAEATFMKKVQTEVANGMEALIDFDFHRNEELLRVEDTARRLRDNGGLGPMDWGDVDELIQLTRDARTLDAEDIKYRQELIRKMMEVRKEEGGVEHESCMRVLMREMVADEFERLWQDNLIPAEDKDDEARMKQQYQREAVYSVELQMNALLGDIVAQEKFEEIDKRSKAAYERGYIGQLLGEEPPDSIWMAMGKGAVSGFVGGAMMVGGGAAMGASAYRFLRTLETSAKQELLKMVQKEEQGKEATIKQPGQIIGELREQMDLLSSTDPTRTTTPENVRRVIAEARARVKLPDLKELDRMRIEQEIAALQRDLVARDITTETEEETDVAVERLHAARAQEIEKAGALAKEARQKRSWFGEKGLFKRLDKFIEKGGREEVGAFAWEIGKRSLEAAAVAGAVGWLTEKGIDLAAKHWEPLGTLLLTAQEREAREMVKAHEEHEKRLAQEKQEQDALARRGYAKVEEGGYMKERPATATKEYVTLRGMERGVDIEREGVVDHVKIQMTPEVAQLLDQLEAQGRGVDWSRLKTHGEIRLNAEGLRGDFFTLRGVDGSEGVVMLDTAMVNGHESVVVKMMTHMKGGGAGETWSSTAAVVENGLFNGLIRGATKTDNWRPEAGQEVQRTDDSYVKMDYNNDGNVDETVTATKFEGNRYGEDWASEAVRGGNTDPIHMKAVDVEAPSDQRVYEWSSAKVQYSDGHCMLYPQERFLGTVQANEHGQFVGTRNYDAVAWGALQRGDRTLVDALQIASSASAEERMALYDTHRAALDADPLVVSNGKVSFWDSGAQRHEQWNAGALEGVFITEQADGTVEVRLPGGVLSRDQVHIGSNGELMIGDLSAANIAELALKQNIEIYHPWAAGAEKTAALKALGIEPDTAHATLHIPNTVGEQDLARVFVGGDKGLWNACGGDKEKLEFLLAYKQFDTPDKAQAVFDQHTQFKSETGAVMGMAAFANFNTADKLLRFPEGHDGAVVRMKGQDYLIENGTIAAVTMEVAGGRDRIAMMGPAEKLSTVTEAGIANHLASTREAFAERIAADRIHAEKLAAPVILSREDAEKILTARAGEHGMEVLREAGVQHGFLKADVPRGAMDAIAGMKAIDANSMDDDAFAKHVIKEQGLSRWKGYDDNLKRVHDLIEDRIDTLQAAGKWDPNTMTVRDVLTATERANMKEIIEAKKSIAPFGAASFQPSTRPWGLRPRSP